MILQAFLSCLVDLTWRLEFDLGCLEFTGHTTTLALLGLGGSTHSAKALIAWLVTAFAVLTEESGGFDSSSQYLSNFLYLLLVY